MSEDPRISEIRDVLSRWEKYQGMPVKTIPEWSMAESLFANVKEILDREPPAPRVFFSGDTVPSGVCVVSKSGLDSSAHFTTDGEWTIPTGLSPYMEVLMPTAAELDAAVERARADRPEVQP